MTRLFQADSTDQVGSFLPTTAAQLYEYISQMQHLLAGTIDGTTRAQIQNNLNLAYQYLQQIGEDPRLGDSGWDPMEGCDVFGPAYGAASYGMGVESSSESQPPSFPVSYQDSAHVVSEDGSDFSVTVGRNDADIREIDAFQPNATIAIPSNAATIALSSQTDESGNPVVLIKITFPNGPTRIIRCHDPEHLSIQSPKPDQVIQDASLGDLISKIEISRPGEVNSEPQGTSPDETLDRTRIWNTHDSVDYFATDGDETDSIYADTVNLSLPDRSHSAYVTKLGDHHYAIEIKDADGRLIRRIETYQTDHLNFNGVDGDNLYYRDATAGGSLTADFTGGIDWNGNVFVNPGASDYLNGNFKAWSDPSLDHDSQITLNG